MTPRTLGVLAALVAALSIVVAVDRPRRPRDPGAQNRILAGFDGARVNRIVIAAPGRADVALERAGDALAIVQPAAYATDAAAVKDLLGSLEFLQWRRRVPRADRDEERGLAAPRLTLTVIDGARTQVVRIGKIEPSLGRVWVARDGGADAYLVDEYYARALDRTLYDLRRRDPLPLSAGLPARLLLESESVAGAKRLELRDAGRCVVIGGACARPDAEQVSALAERLGDLRLTRFLDGDVRIADADLRARVVAGDGELRLGGRCPATAAEVLATSPIGAGCVRAEVVDQLAEAVADPPSWVERTIVPVAPHAIRKIVIAGELTLERQGGAWAIVDAQGRRAPVDDEAMRAWLEELTSYRASAVVPINGPQAGAGGATLEIELDGGERIGLLLWGKPDPDHALVVRRGDAVALVAHPDLARVFVPDASQFHDRTILSFEPSALAGVDFSGEGGDEKAVRGESTDDWSLTAPLAIPVDRNALGALRDTVSALHATRVIAPSLPAPARRTITLTLDPPPTAPPDTPPVRHVLRLGARLPDGGCAIAKDGGDGVAFAIDRDTCDAIDTHLATRVLFAPETVTAVTLPDATYERHGPAWYASGSARATDELAAKLDRLVDALHEADVIGYGAVAAAPRTTITIATTDGKLALAVASPWYGLTTRAVRYRLPPGVCADFASICK